MSLKKILGRVFTEKPKKREIRIEYENRGDLSNGIVHAHRYDALTGKYLGQPISIKVFTPKQADELIKISDKIYQEQRFNP